MDGLLLELERRPEACVPWAAGGGREVPTTSEQHKEEQ
jgi:hypothetical protein